MQYKTYKATLEKIGDYENDEWIWVEISFNVDTSGNRGKATLLVPVQLVEGRAPGFEVEFRYRVQ